MGDKMVESKDTLNYFIKNEKDNSKNKLRSLFARYDFASKYLSDVLVESYKNFHKDGVYLRFLTPDSLEKISFKEDKDYYAKPLLSLHSLSVRTEFSFSLINIELSENAFDRRYLLTVPTPKSVDEHSYIQFPVKNLYEERHYVVENSRLLSLDINYRQKSFEAIIYVPNVTIPSKTLTPISSSGMSVKFPEYYLQVSFVSDLKDYFSRNTRKD